MLRSALIAVMLLLFTSLFFYLKEISSSRCFLKTYAYERLECLKPYFDKLTFRQNADIALSKALQLQKDGVIDDCHLAAHFVGEANYLKNDRDVGKAFATCPKGCVEGCYHGVMEAYISESNDLNKTLTSISSTCNSVSADVTLKRQCIHGVGHGLLRHDVSSLPTALEKCEEFKTDSKICQGGVFMENMNNYLLMEEKNLSLALPTICKQVEKFNGGEFSDFCYEAVGEGLMFYTGHDLKKSHHLCQFVPEDYIKVCENAASQELSNHQKSLK